MFGKRPLRTHGERKRIPHRRGFWGRSDPPLFQTTALEDDKRATEELASNDDDDDERTNLEKVAVVRIGKAVCKANDMVDVLLLCVR